jgi:hypothetical protein
VTVTGADDDVTDGHVTYSLAIGAAVSDDPDYQGFDAGDVSITNLDDDTPGITVTTLDAETTESGGKAAFTIVLDRQPTADVHIDLKSSDLTEGTVSPASVHFTPATWSQEQTVTITGVDDDIDDDDVSYNIVTEAVTSSDPNYDGLDAEDITLRNSDDDWAGILVSEADGETSEGGGSASLTIVLDSEPTSIVTIPIRSGDLSEGDVAPAVVSFSPSSWSVAQTVTITGVDDHIVDGDVSYWITTAAATSGDPSYDGLDADDVAFINRDDDLPGVAVSEVDGDTSEDGGSASFSLVLDSQPTAVVTIYLDSGDESEGAVFPDEVSFTPSDWSVPRTVTVTGMDDDVDDGDVTYSVNTAPAASADPEYSDFDANDVTVLNVDDDVAGFTVSAISRDTTEAGETATFAIRLDSEPLADVLVTCYPSDTTEGAVSPATLTFTAADWHEEQAVTVTGADDDLVDGDVEFAVLMSNAMSGDPTYEGLEVADVKVVNQDDDVPQLTFSSPGGQTTESGGKVLLEVALNGSPSTPVTLNFESTDAREASVWPDQVTVTEDQLPVVVLTVTGVDDAVDDGDAEFQIRASTSSDDKEWDGLSDAVSLTNIDDDTAGITISPISGNTTEQGGNATFSVHMNSEPTASVTVGVSSSNPEEGTVAPTQLVFDAVNWNQDQHVTLAGVDDPLADGDASYYVIVSPAVSSDAKYDGLDGADVSLRSHCRSTTRPS